MSSSCPPRSWKVRSTPSLSVLGSNPTQMKTASASAAIVLVARPMKESDRVTPNPEIAGIAIDCLCVRLPVINHVVVAEEEADSIVRGRKEGVRPGFLGHEIASPANGEMIDWLVRSKAAFSPIEVDVLVGAHHFGRTLQLVVTEILALEPLVAARGGNKLGTPKDVIENRRINGV